MTFSHLPAQPATYLPDICTNEFLMNTPSAQQIYQATTNEPDIH
jgi:hypothetical protein